MKELAYILICGWAMMVAPGTNYDKPVADWHFMFAFDTARECEEVILGQFNRLEKKKDSVGMEKNASGQRCIPMDWIAPHKKK